jgi:hypothetical protein
MDSPSGGRIGPPPLSRTRFIAGLAIIVLAAALAWYAVGERQRADRSAAEVARLHEVELALRDSLARLDSALRTRPATAPAASPRP